MGSFSLIHWLVLGLIILLLFGGNRFSSMMGDVAKGLKGFKQGLADDPAPPPAAVLADHATAPPPLASDVSPQPTTADRRDPVQR